MKKIIIYQPSAKSKRIKVYIPYELHKIRNKFKQINSSYWHPNQKLWSVINSKNNMELMKGVFGNQYLIEEAPQSTTMKTIPLNTQSEQAINDLIKKLTLKRYSLSTLNSYKSMLHVYFSYFNNFNIKQISKNQIEGFIYEMIKKHKISESVQNQLINSIKAYYEHVLGFPREFYDIERPKRSVNLPNVLSEDEVFKIINYPINIKHKAILWTIYSCGLRIGELSNLRVIDIHSDEGFVFIKDSKGKRDRRTILSKHLIELLRSYYKLHKPSYWLFEGQSGGKYSATSIRNIFRKAVNETASNPWSTVHTLRHSFATHCIQNNVNLRHVQAMLGHASPKTTELYTKAIEINNKKITSPLDNLLKNRNLQT